MPSVVEDRPVQRVESFEGIGSKERLREVLDRLLHVSLSKLLLLQSVMPPLKHCCCSVTVHE